MITVNKFQIQWHDGMTLVDLDNIIQADDRFKLFHGEIVMYSLNKKMIDREHLAKIIIQDEDEVDAMLFVAGG